MLSEPTGWGWHELPVSASEPARRLVGKRASASLEAVHFLFIPGCLLYILGLDHGNRAGDGADLFDSSGVGFHL